MIDVSIHYFNRAITIVTVVTDDYGASVSGHYVLINDVVVAWSCACISLLMFYMMSTELVVPV